MSEINKLKYTVNGDMDLSDADHANIPVNIFIEEKAEGQWQLWADNFMPRKAVVAQQQYEIEAESKEMLLAALAKYVVPLYEAALLNIKTSGTNYYWQKD